MATNRTYPEPNLQSTDTLTLLEAQSIDFVERFGGGLRDFVDLLGITRQMPVQAGFTIKFYEADEATLASGDVAEGELIPLSKVSFKEHSSKELGLKKYRKSTTFEAIQRYGRQNAISRTDNAFLKEIQSEIRTSLFEVLKTAGTQQVNLNDGTLQGALASAWGALQTIFENDAVQTVAFVNPMDVANEIATKAVTLENRFGLSYYTDVTGVMVFMTTQVERGKVFATAPENLVLAYIPSSSEAFSEFAMTADTMGYIGVTHEQEKRSLTTDTIAAYGILIFPERLDGVVEIDITAVVPEG